MKITKILSLLAMFVATSLFATSLLAQLPELPIGSTAALKSYAYEQVAGGQIAAWSSSVLPGGTTYHTVSAEKDSPRGADKIIEGLLSKPLDFEVANTRDPVYLSSYLWNETGDILFSGSRSTRVLKTGDGLGWYLEDVGVSVELASEVPIKIPGIESARIVIRDERGNTIREEYLVVRDGKVYFPTGYTDRSGELLLGIRDKDSNLSGVAYDLSSGKQRYGSRVITGVAFAIKGVFSFKYYDGLPDVFQFSLGFIPKDTLVVIDLVKTTDTKMQFNHDYVAFEGTGTRPLAFFFRQEGDPMWYRVPWPEKGFGISIVLPKGKTHFIFQSEPDQFRDLPWRDWYGGKG